MCACAGMHERKTDTQTKTEAETGQAGEESHACCISWLLSFAGPVLGLQLRSAGVAASASNCCAISPAHTT